MPTSETYVLSFSCDDVPGIVARISSALFEAGATILEAQQFDDALTGRFFARIEFAAVRADGLETVGLDTLLPDVLERLGADFSVRKASSRRRVLIMASKQDHCLADLLYRWRTGELPMEVAAVVSNHPRDVYRAIHMEDVPFYHFPVEPGRKREQEKAVSHLIEELDIDFVVLARYMQILSDEFAEELSGRCINIHHSFLPGFKGAKPYHQAHTRGVKIVGATAHYVTGDLDEGPIIAQAVEDISHRDSPEDLVRKGRDIERRVLARAVRHHLEDRVLLNGLTTVVFPD